MRLRHALVLALPVLQGSCALVAQLGDPKELADAGTSGDDAGVAPEGGQPGDGGSGEGGAGPFLQAKAIAVGASHVCAVVEDATGSAQNGTIRCWGSNDTGQLGNDTSPQTYSSRPVPVLGRDAPEQQNAQSLTIAAYYSCATTTDGFLLCWGRVPEGSGVTRVDPTPADEPSYMDYNARALSQVSAASMGPTGGCVTLAVDGSLVCWGGDLAPSTPDGGVVVLDGGVIVGDAFASVAVGTAHACGIAATSSSSSSDVECWGDNEHGQTGLPFSALVSHPNHLGLGAKGEGPLKSVASGGDTSCALFVNGSVYCWGRNDYGQLGQGAPGPDSYEPLQVQKLSSPAIAISVGYFHVCALLLDRSVACWGDDSAAQLGVGPSGPTSSGVPSPVMRAPGHALGGVLSIAAGGDTTCATLLGDPEVSCWGANEQGQSGQEGTLPVPYATRVAW